MGAKHMRLMLEAGLLLLFAVLFLLMAALAVKAQQPDAQPQGAKAQQQPAMEDEIIVRGRRNEPDFQEEWEHHRKEFDRLSKIYGDPFTPNRRSDRMTDTPNPDKGKSVMRSPSSDTVQGRPSRD
ncbi:hypothetical protein [Niveispirillum sp. KHB5.9]|uniref:hypothetical protein n=1 Tax=Niveispirillum sp. KHB5.9 TaxID=3400269 RepID=UPI003A855881